MLPIRTFLPALLAASLLASQAARADVRLPSIFGDHMVLQGGIPVPVWGLAQPGEQITVQVASSSGTATADSKGAWRVTLPPLRSGTTPVTMTVNGGSTITCTDVLIGDVWLCSGQSNMEFPLSAAGNARSEIPLASLPQIRFFHERHAIAHTPARGAAGRWEVCTPATASSFSAVGYFFGRELNTHLQRPIGLIGSYWGGTPIEAWISLPALKANPAFSQFVDQWNKLDATFAQGSVIYPLASREYASVMSMWRTSYGRTYDATMDAWRQAVRQAQLKGVSPPLPPGPPAPTPAAPRDPAGDQRTPAALFNGMLAPIQPYAIKGVLWYQGESNGSQPAQYALLFPAFINALRDSWGQGAFPFLFVQLPGYAGPEAGQWPELRDAQARALSLPDTAMAASIDIGDPANLHPIDKVDIGHRLALAARRRVYHEKVIDSGPVFRHAKRDSASSVRISFDTQGTGLIAGRHPGASTAGPPPDPTRLTGFEIAGPDKLFKPADARIDGGTVILSSHAVPDPAAVRYDWQPYPQGNLYNQEGLPALPFRATIPAP